MKTYEVELRRTSYVTVEVQAEDAAAAETAAWAELASGSVDESFESASWDIESLEELK